jgi:hypothetical protein
LIEALARKGLAPHQGRNDRQEDAVAKCDICDEEFDTDNQLMQHKAKMHAGQTGGMEPPSEKPEEDMVDAREGMMPKAEEQMPEAERGDEDLEEPDYKRASGE